MSATHVECRRRANIGPGICFNRKQGLVMAIATFILAVGGAEINHSKWAPCQERGTDSGALVPSTWYLVPTALLRTGTVTTCPWALTLPCYLTCTLIYRQQGGLAWLSPLPTSQSKFSVSSLASYLE